MPESSDLESRMRRAISSSVAEQWRRFQGQFTREFVFGQIDTLANDPDRETIINKIAEWFQDPRILFLKSWEGESSFREELFENPRLILNPSFMMDWNDYRNKEMSYSLMEKNDPLSNLAMLEMPEEKAIPDEKEMLTYYFNYFIKLGPTRSGRLEEVIGPMGSGKSNFLAWKAIRALQKGFVVFTNFALKNVPQSYRSNWHEIHSYTELFSQTIEMKKNGYGDIIFWIIDEQGRTPGASSQTITMKEGRWTNEILTIIRKFGVFLTRARQSDNIPEDQISWVSSMVEKSVQSPELVTVKYLHNGDVQEQYSFVIPSMKEYYDTNDPALIYMDLNMEMLQKYAVRKQQKGMDPIDAMQDFIRISKKVDEAQWKKFDQSIEELESGVDQMIKEDRRGKNPNSLKNLKQFRKASEKNSENTSEAEQKNRKPEGTSQGEAGT